MSFRGLLRHTVAIVTPGTPDITDTDESGFPIAGDPTVVIVPGLIQPRDSHEVKSPTAEGVLYSEYVIFLEVQPITAAAYICEADDDGPIDGARRFQIDGIQSFLYGRDPHLEVYATLISGSYVSGL